MIATGALEQTGLSQSPADYFESLQILFEKAAERSGGAVHRHYKIGDDIIRVSFCGTDGLFPKLSPAFEHLSVNAPQTPAFTISVWDSASTGVEMPPPPWEHRQITGRGDIQGFNDERIFAVFQLGTNSLHMVDRAAKRALFWVRNAKQIPASDAAHPLRLILNQWTEPQGWLILHAGAVGNAEGGVLIAGKSGSGKSTTALSCLHSKLGLAAEDTVLLGFEPRPTAYSLYSSAKLTRSSLELLPRLKELVCNPDKIDSEKGLIFLFPRMSQQLALQFPVTVILLPSLSPGQPLSFEKISAIEGLKALAPSSILQVPGAGTSEFFGMSRLTKTLPVYRFHLGDEIQRIPEAITRLLSTL